jgi:hypothetical protein
MPQGGPRIHPLATLCDGIDIVIASSQQHNRATVCSVISSRIRRHRKRIFEVHKSSGPQNLLFPAVDK